MTTIARLVAELGLDAGDFDKGVQHVEKSAGGIGGMLQTAIGTAAGFGIAQKGLDLLGGAFDTVKGAVFGMNSTLQTSELQFGTLMGDSDAAKQHVADLFEFAKKTPFETGPIIEASRMLLTFGGTALDTKDQLGLIGDAAAATGAPINELGFWTGRLYANLKAGQPFGEAAARLQELAVLSPEARLQMEQLQKAGGSAEDVFTIFNGSLGKFTGAMEKQAGTWEGLTSTFSDTLSIVGAQAMKPFFDLASNGLNQLNTLLGNDGVGNAISQFAASFSSGIQTVFAVGQQVFDWFQTALPTVMTTLDGVIQGLGPTFDRLSGAFNTIKDAIGALIPDPLEEMVRGFSEGASNSNLLQQGLDTLVGVVNAVSAGIENVTKFLQDNKAAQVALVTVLTGVATAWTAIKVVQLATTIATTAITAATSAYTAVQWLLNAALTANPIGIVVVALAALAGGLIYAYNTSEEFRNVVNSAFSVLQTVVGGAIHFVMDLINTLKSTWDSLTGNIQFNTGSIGDILYAAFMGYITIVTLPLQLFTNLINSIWSAIPVDIQEDLILIGQTLLDKFNQFLTDTQTWLTNTLGSVITSFGEMLANISTAMTNIGVAIDTAWTTISAQVGMALTALKDTVMQPIWDGITSIVNDIWNNQITQFIATSVITMLGTITQFGRDVISALGTIAKDVLAAAAAVGQAIIDGMAGAVKAGAQRLADEAANAARAALDAAKHALGISSPSSEGFEVGDQLMAGIAGGMQDGARMYLSGHNLTMPQFGGILERFGFTSDQIAAACGPIAAQGIAAGFGQALDFRAVMAAAKGAGWTSAAGMGGPGNFQRLLGALGIGSASISVGQAMAQATMGRPIAISTPLHYFLAQDYDPASGKFNVGNTGLALTGGSEWMTLARIQQLAGGIQSFISPTGFASGGWLNEPIFGIGASGAFYSLAESGPEYVMPRGQMAALMDAAGRGGRSGAQVTINARNTDIDEYRLIRMLNAVEANHG